MATRIRLMRIGKMREPHYRIVVADSRTKRDGRAIELVGEYHPKDEPSTIKVDSDRIQHWLRVGAQPTESVAAILRVTGDWQRFKGLPAPEPMKTAAPRPDRRAAFEQAARESLGESAGETAAPRKRAAKAAPRGAAGRPEQTGGAGPAASQAAAEAAEGSTRAPAPEASAQEASAQASKASAPASGASAPASGASAPASGASAPASEA